MACARRLGERRGADPGAGAGAARRGGRGSERGPARPGDAAGVAAFGVRFGGRVGDRGGAPAAGDISGLTPVVRIWGACSRVDGDLDAVVGAGAHRRRPLPSSLTRPIRRKTSLMPYERAGLPAEKRPSHPCAVPGVSDVSASRNCCRARTLCMNWAGRGLTGTLHPVIAPDLDAGFPHVLLDRWMGREQPGEADPPAAREHPASAVRRGRRDPGRRLEDGCSTSCVSTDERTSGPSSRQAVRAG